MANRFWLRGLVAALIVPCTFATRASAQADTSSVPRELVVLLLHQIGEGTNYNGRPVISGSLSPAVSSMVGVPPGGVIVGMVAWPNYTDVVGTAPGTVDAARFWFAADFVKRGYSPADNNSFMATTGGFRDPAPSATTGYCTSTTYLLATVRPRDPTTAEFRVRITPNNSLCLGNRGRPGGFVDPSTFPLLYNPPAAPRSGRCFPTSGNPGMSTQLSTTMSPSDLLKHYATQVETAGWKAVSVPSVISGNWSKKDSTGHDMTLTLTVTPVAGVADCRIIGMSITDPNR